MKQKILCLDLETTIEPIPKIRVITTKEADDSAEIIYNYNEDGEFSITKHKAVKDYIESFDVLIIHNAVFDVPILQRNHVYPKKIWDTMVAEQLISGGEQKRLMGYKDLVKVYCGVELNKTEQTSDWSQELTQDQINYCYEDVNYLYDIAKAQQKKAIHYGSLAHITLKNEIIKLVGKDFIEGYPINISKVANLEHQCKLEYQKAFGFLLSKLPLSFFYKSNVTKKLMYKIYEESFPYHSVVLPPYKLNIKLDEISIPDEHLKQFFLENPESEALVTIASPSFASKLLKHYNIEFETTDKNFINELIEDPDKYKVSTELLECLQAVLKAREVEKISGTYLEGLDELPVVSGQKRMIPKLSYTVSGRLTLSPIAQLPKEDDNKTDLQNAIRALYIPPVGYTTLGSDVSSQEDLNGAFYFGEVDKVRYVEEGFDLYLLLAAKVFKNFEYTEASQTKELKKKYKSFRQAVKAISLAKNYSAGKGKIYDMYTKACDKQGIPIELSPEDLEEAWATLYPKLAQAQKDLSNIVSGMIENLYSDYGILDNLSEPQRKLLSFGSYDKTGDPEKDRLATKANNFRKQLLESLNLRLTISSILGLKRIYNVSFFNKIKLNPNPKFPNKVSVTELSNYTTQASGSEAIGLALIMIKKLYPSIIVPTIVHDSIVCFVPEKGIDNLSLDDIRQGIQGLMSYANYLVYGKYVKIDSEYTQEGF